MPRKCHNHRQYETLQSLIEMSPMSAPGMRFLQHYSESCHVVHQIKENEEKKTCHHHPPPTPTPLTPKKTLHLHCQTPRKSTFSKINRSEFEEQITNMWAQIKPFWAYYLPKIKTSNTKHNHETPHVHYNSNGHTFLWCIIHCMGLGTKMLAANAQLVMAKVAYILASNVNILVENHKT